MSHTSEKISSNKVKLSFSVPAASFDEAMQKAYLKMRGRLNVPGFRKGKAPRKLIESIYGEATFYDEALDLIFPDMYQEAVKAEDLHPVDRPELDLEQIGSGKELKFSVEVFVRPDVTLGDYKALSAVKHLHPVSEEEIDRRIQQDVSRATVTQEVTDRAVQKGDTANIDYAGTVDGAAFEGGTDKGHSLEIGSHSFIPGFEEQVVGMAIGEEKDITVRFPEDYHAKDLAGKEAVFHVKVNGISVKLKPELDDEFAADVSEHSTYEAYHQAIVQELTDIRDRNAQTRLENELIQQAVDQADCDIPDRMISDEVSSLLRNMQLRMAYQGLRFEDYLKYTGQDEAGVREMLKADATNNVKTQLVLDAIRKAEGLEPSEADVEAQIENHAKEMGRELKDYRPTLNDSQLAYYKDLAGAQMVIKLLNDNAKITLHEGPAHEDEPVNAGEILEKVAEALPEEQEASPEKDQTNTQ